MNKMKNNFPYDENRFNELITELNECREDMRNCEAQLVQVIATAGAILGILLGASYVNQEVDIVWVHVMFYLSVCVFGTAFTFISLLETV